jgi:hypothetical protein
MPGLALGLTMLCGLMSVWPCDAGVPRLELPRGSNAIRHVDTRTIVEWRSDPSGPSFAPATGRGPDPTGSLVSISLATAASDSARFSRCHPIGLLCVLYSRNSHLEETGNEAADYVIGSTRHPRPDGLRGGPRSRLLLPSGRGRCSTSAGCLRSPVRFESPNGALTVWRGPAVSAPGIRVRGTCQIRQLPGLPADTGDELSGPGASRHSRIRR